MQFTKDNLLLYAVTDRAWVGEKSLLETWFNKMKDLAAEFGYAKEVKEFKQNPDAYKGHIGDISTVIRICLTARANTPDMYEIMKVLGKDSVIKRLEYAIK